MKTHDINHQIHVERDINIHLENKKVSIHFFWFIWILYAVVSMTKNCFSAAMADIVAEGFMLKSQTELITSMFYIVYTPMQIVGGIAADKISPERLIKIGLIGAAISNTVIFFFNTSYPIMIAAWIFNAVAQFGIWPSVFKIVSSQCIRSDRPKMFFLINLSFNAGLVLSYGVGAILTDWRMNFSISAVALLICAVALHFYDRHVDKYMLWDKVIEAKPIDKCDNTGKNISTLGLFCSSGFFLLLVVVFLRDSFSSIVKRISATMLDETFGVGPSLGTFMSTLIIVSILLGIIAVSAMISHSLIKNYVMGTLIGLIVSTVLALLFVFAPSVATNVILMCLMAGFSNGIAVFTTFINSSFTKYGKNATAAGISNAASACGFVAPLIAVLIQENSGWSAVKILLVVIGALSVILSLILLPIYNRFKKREAEEERAKEKSISAV